MTDLTKTCTKCKEAKPLNLFHRRPDLKDGLRSDCKICVLKRQAKYYKANAEKIAIKQAAFQKANAEKIAIKKAAYQKANAEKIAKQKAAYYKANAVCINQRNAAYYKANAEKIAKQKATYYKANALHFAKLNAEYRKANAEKIAKIAATYYKANAETLRKKMAKRNNIAPYIRISLNAKRKATKLQATPPWLTPEHLKQMQLVYQEAKLLSTRGFKHQVDHIVPLRGENVSGLHVPWNLRAIPASVNRSKSNATPDTLPTVRYF